MAQAGKKLIDVVVRAWESPFTLASNFARDHTALVAMAASRGLITSVHPVTGEGLRSWHITGMGLAHLRAQRGRVIRAA